MGIMDKSLDILYEDNHLLVINKPARTLVQGDKTGDVPLIDIAKDYIKKKYQKPGDVFLGVVHRLDRPVSGVLLFARTSKALERMNRLFHDREVKKTYWAMIADNPPTEDGKLVDWIKKDHSVNKVKVLKKEKGGAQKAVLTYNLISHINGVSLLEVNPETGRPHQIRAQLASMGCPIIGDLKYEGQKIRQRGQIALHARALSFIHPVKKEKIRIFAPVPEGELWERFNSL